MNHVVPRTCAKTLPVSMALALGLGGVAAHAASFTTVTNCADDNSPGTLRAALGALTDNNAIVDVSACSTITLLQGELALPFSVAILGPATGTTTIDAGHRSRVFEDVGQTAGSGIVTLSNLTIRGGRVALLDKPAYGGCISGFAVTLNSSIVTDCSAHSDTGGAEGGAISGASVTLYRSTVTQSAADSASGKTFGGAVATNQLICTDSTVSGSQASGHPGSGGGLAVYAGVRLERCTIDTNTADKGGGLLALGRGVASDVVTIIDSTISGNRGYTADGGVYSGGALTIRNSTIANNYAAKCAGMYASLDAQIDSSIIARNASGSTACVDLVVAGALTGAHNLIGVDNGGLPSGTILADPRLAPLADHGGFTRTHALLRTSPAIDAGSNVPNLSTDQRSNGFARQVGVAPDIGAYERQADDDELFYAGFE